MEGRERQNWGFFFHFFTSHPLFACGLLLSGFAFLSVVSFFALLAVWGFFFLVWLGGTSEFLLALMGESRWKSATKKFELLWDGFLWMTRWGLNGLQDWITTALVCLVCVDLLISLLRESCVRSISSVCCYGMLYDSEDLCVFSPWVSGLEECA